ncbi:MAG: pilus (MSHA type) biogenesis protein MshL [Immundisolibacteraceae bacterium]|nr:pilus (MSHA type) biogenesis protein MshL [Immundisolibacteraceae bacterium]
MLFLANQSRASNPETTSVNQPFTMTIMKPLHSFQPRLPAATYLFTDTLFDRTREQNRIRFWTGMALIVVIAVTSGCSHQPLPASATHLSQDDHALDTAAEKPASSIPSLITGLPAAIPADQTNQQFFTLVVTDVAVDEVLFALARDAGMDVDIRADVSGAVTLNAIDQPLERILERIATLANLRFRLQHGSLIIEADLPYRHTYAIDYINMDRSVIHQIAVSTQIATSGSSELAGGGGSGNNNSSTQLTSRANNDFWDQLIANVGAIVAPRTVSLEAEQPTAIIANRIASLLTVTATQSQHREVAAYIDELLTSAHRQVLIEATIAEVNLSRDYQAGVDWSVFGNRGWGINANTTSTNFSDAPFAALTYTNTSSSLGNIDVAITMLQTFGDVKVLSSPKLIALNNQTALLKVVDERVYFTFEVEREENDDGNDDITVETTVNTVPVGLVMAVTPQINENGEVTLNVRPTISRIIDFVQFDDPFIRGNNGEASLISRVPEIQVREIETVLRVASGQTVVLGGLMQDTVDNSSEGVPLLSNLPYIGEAFKYENDISRKSELVIFLRPVVTSRTNMDTPPFDRYQPYLPDTDQPLSSYRQSADTLQ